jgi:hypothetical protein
MPKAILEFDLPQEEYEHKMALWGTDYMLVLWELDNWLRAILKYDDNISDDEYKAYDATREQLQTLMEERNVIFE